MAIPTAPSQRLFEFLRSLEGLKLEAYQDSAGIWTIGIGTIEYEDGTHVKKGDVITKERAYALLRWEVAKKTVGVKQLLKDTALDQKQFDALVSFAYNVGTGALKTSTLLKRVKLNPADHAGIRAAFMMWDKAHVDGQLEEVPGLVIRRKREADLYCGGTY